MGRVKVGGDLKQGRGVCLLGKFLVYISGRISNDVSACAADTALV